MGLTPTTRSLAGSALAGLLVGAAFLLTLRSMDRTRDLWLQRTQLTQAIEVVNQGLSDLKDAETGQRGYLLTGNTAYLAPYERGRVQALESLHRFEGLAAAQALPPAMQAELESLMTEKLDELGHTVQLAREGHFNEALDLVKRGQGLLLMDHIRSVQGALSEALRHRRTEIDERLAAERWRFRRTLLLLGGLALLALLSGAWTIHRSNQLRSLTEHSLAASEARFRALAEHAPVGIFEIDARGQRSYFNNHLCVVAGIGLDEASTQGFRHRVHPDDITRVIAHWAEGQDRDKESHIEFRFVRPDGDIRWVESWAAALPPEDGGFSSYIGIVVDRTEQRLFEEVLRASEHRFRTLAEAAPVGIYEYDFARKRVYANEAHCRLAGVQRGEATRERLRASIHPEDRAAVIARVEDDMREGRSSELTYRLQHLDGTILWVQSWGTPIEDLLGQSVAYLIITQDITAMRAAQAEIQAKAEALESANKDLEAFAYSVSHDLRAPLRHIDGFVGLLRRALGDAMNDRARRHLDVISGSARQMGALIDDLLTFSRMGRTEIAKTDVDLTALVQRVREELAPDAVGRDIEWHVGPLPRVHADPALLRLVLVNLLSNAIKLTRGRNPARIELSSKLHEGEVSITLQDNGAGFDMRYANKLFGVFQRLHGQDEFEGTGIGLANVARIIHKHGGTVSAEGAVNQGATFTFTLPRPEIP